MSEGLGAYFIFAFHMAVVHHDAAIADDGVHGIAVCGVEQA